MGHARFSLALAAIAAVRGGGGAAALPLTDIFSANSGVAGFPTCFRQPIVVVVSSQHLVVFAEGRDNGGYCSGGADGSNSSVWVRVSKDQGLTWTPPAMLYDAPPQPDYLSAVYDAEAHRVLLFIQTTPNLQLHSDDGGLTWSKPAPVVISLPTGFSATPGVAHGIQVEGELCSEPTCNATAGRLIVAWVCHSKKEGEGEQRLSDVSCVGCFSCFATSDDHGEHWVIAPSGVSVTQEGSREASLVQLRASAVPGAGRGAVVWATERNMGANPGHRWHALSLDGGKSIASVGNDAGLPDGDTKNWTGIVAGSERVGDAVIVTTPMAVGVRADMGLFVSHDEARTWDAGVLLVGGPAGYSDLGTLNATHAVIVLEHGRDEFAAAIGVGVFEVPRP